MTDDRIAGTAKEGVGRVQNGIGGITSDEGLQVKGKLNEVAGQVQDAYGRVRSQAEDTFNQVRGRAQDTYGEVDEYLREKPLHGLAIGIGIGFIIGVMMNSRRVIYVSK